MVVQPQVLATRAQRAFQYPDKNHRPWGKVGAKPCLQQNVPDTFGNLPCLVVTVESQQRDPGFEIAVVGWVRELESMIVKLTV